MPSKNITMRRLIDGVMYDLMLATNTVQVFDENTNKTLSELLTEILSAIGSKASSDDLIALQTKFNNLVQDAPEAYDTLLEISNYISTHQDEYTALLSLVNGKVSEEEGKGLSTNDFTNELKAKLEALYTVEQIEAKFSEMNTKIDQIQSGEVILSAENVKYDNGDITNVKEALDKLLYQDLVITLSANVATTQEIGVSLSDIIFTWTYSKEVVSQTFDGSVIADASVRTSTYTGPLTTAKTFTLKANDGTKDFSKTISFAFYNKVYWGNAVEPGDIDSDFVKALASSKLVSAKSSVGTISANAASGEYIYYAQPASWADPVFNIGGFDTEFDLVATFDFTNASGYTSSYKVFKSGQAGLGSTSMTVK